MTQISDNLYLGSAQTEVEAVQSGGLGYGPMGRFTAYDIVPLTANVSNLALTQTPGGAGKLTLTAGTGVTKSVNPSGVTIYTFDVPRGVKITSAGNDTGATFTVDGYDVYGAAMTYAIAGGSGAAVSTAKAFSAIVDVKISTAAASNVKVGTSDMFGLPLCIVDPGYIIHTGWASTLAADAGTLVCSDLTSPATTTTGDVRGTYQPTSASNGNRRLVVSMAGSHAQFGTGSGGSTVTAILGVTQV